MKKNRIVGGVEEQGELICELPGCGEVEFAETENPSDEALDHANSESTETIGIGLGPHGIWA
jgi:hypothetical protein